MAFVASWTRNVSEGLSCSPYTACPSVASSESVSEEAVIGSCPSFNDFSMSTFDDVKNEYKVNQLKRSSVELVFGRVASTDSLAQQGGESEGGRRSLSKYSSLPLPSLRSFYKSYSCNGRESGGDNKIDGMDYYDFVDLVRGSPT
eukprot:TRINITY_DN4367_c1_g2_i1.p8 TRINITY_DN4367_c1_g2~~TRINITY_DN4367_c1_g2_i1.p8  ORF type:complete len:145 (-),score=35.88 TRINITY_DN4367_c1_g2_i1:1628-2062(-)